VGGGGLFLTAGNLCINWKYQTIRTISNGILIAGRRRFTTAALFLPGKYSCKFGIPFKWQSCQSIPKSDCFGDPENPFAPIHSIYKTTRRPQFSAGAQIKKLINLTIRLPETQWQWRRIENLIRF